MVDVSRSEPAPGSASPSAPGSLRVLVVEDDASIGEPLTEGLEFEGFTATWVRSGAAALDAVDRCGFVLLDLGLPDLDGTVVCRRIRERSAVPIIVVTAREDEFDRVRLLELGADDYVVKPFGFRELVARIRAVQRRIGAPVTHSAAPQVFGPLEIDRDGRRVRLAGAELELSPKEFDLLVFLSDSPGVVRTREDILAHVWDEHWWGPTKTLDVHVASLRRKLHGLGVITTLRGVGYRFDPPE